MFESGKSLAVAVNCVLLTDHSSLQREAWCSRDSRGHSIADRPIGPEIQAFKNCIASPCVIWSKLEFSPFIVSWTVGYVVLLFSRFMLTHKTELPSGWVPRMLVQCGLSLEMMLDIFTYLYESQVWTLWTLATSTCSVTHRPHHTTILPMRRSSCPI